MAAGEKDVLRCAARNFEAAVVSAKPVALVVVCSAGGDVVPRCFESATVMAGQVGGIFVQL